MTERPSKYEKDMERRAAAIHNRAPWPHAGGCARCRAAGVCNVCAQPTTAAQGRCTNGRCVECHRTVCTPGGDTSPGHGYGPR